MDLLSRRRTIRQTLGPRLILKGILFLSLGFIQASAFGQSRSEQLIRLRDSLLLDIQTATDTNLARGYYMLSFNGAVSDSAAWGYAEKAVELSDSLDFPIGIIKGSNVLGHLNFAIGEFQMALSHYKRSLNTAISNNMEEQIIHNWSLLPDTYFNLDEFDSVFWAVGHYRDAALEWKDSTSLGDAYLREANYFISQNYTKQAVEATLEATEIFEVIQDSFALADALSSLGMVLSREGERNEAEKYFLKAGAIYEQVDNVFGKMANLINYGILNKDLGRLEKADSIFTYTKDFLEETRENLKISAYYYGVYDANLTVNRSEVMVLKDQFDSAISSLTDLLENRPESLDRISHGAATLSLATAYLESGNLADARKYASQAVEDFETTGIDDELVDALRILINIESESRNYKAAYEAQTRLQTLSDSLNSVTRRKEYQSLLLDYEKEIDQRKISELEQDRLRDANQRNILLGITGALGLAAIALFLFFRYRRARDQELLAQERELDEMKTRFFTQISHELRTPLTLILGPLEQLISAQRDEKDKDKLLLMRRNANRLLELVNQVLDLAKLKEGKLSLSATEVDIVSWSRIIYSSFDSKAELKNIRYEFDAPEAEIDLWLDKEKYQQILSNLISNGLKFTPENGELSVRMTDSQDRVLLQVTDNGPGMSEAELSSIFDAFYQASTAGDGPFEAGTGIGLALVKELVELHGGTIQATSTPGSGSQFTLTFLKGTAHLSASFLQSQPSETIIQDIPSVEKETAILPAHLEKTDDLPLLLIAEDIPDMQEYLKSILADQYRLLIAGDGEEAYELAKIHTPDLVIADIMMPKMDGMEFVRLLKDNDQTDHIPVIFLSAKSSMEDRIEGWKREAFAFLSKPFNPRELLLVVESALKMQVRMQARFQGEVLLKPAEVAVTSRESKFLTKLTSYLDTHLDNTELNMEELASEMALSRSQLSRKLKALTGKTPTLFVRQFRLEKARQLLAKDFGNVSEVSDEVGFSSAAYFSRVFTEAFGISPSDFQKQAKTA